MVTRVTYHRWLLRDVRPTYVLLMLVAVAVIMLAYLVDWSTVRRERVVQPQTVNNEQRYAGWIIIPTGGGYCWTFVIDNRTGHVRGGGSSKCDEATRQFDDQGPPQNMDTLRLREVGKAFRNDGR